MTTFVLKKYQDTPVQQTSTDVSKVDGQPDANAEPKKEDVTIEVRVSDSVAKIVASALYKALPNSVEVTEKEEDNSETNKVISTEDINKDPATLINKIKTGDNVLIISKGFHTAKEDWFLSSLETKQTNVFYTVESFVKHVCKQLNITESNEV